MNIYECRWTIRRFNVDKRIIWSLEDKKNLLVDDGEKLIVDTIFRNNGASYFPGTSFYVGLFYGNSSESTSITTIPSEPASLYGYSRQEVERSSVGFPTIEKHEGDWRVVSKTLTFAAVGGIIGPVNGIFLCTSIDSAGTLIGVLPFGTEQQIRAGESMTCQAKIKLK